jgi:2-polyprenyl-3-methyl-5-hydroxy-6-metoxy-1,4-benzoquinol methylase
MQVREHAVEQYPLGHSIPEQRRLVEQAVILRPLTERFFRDAGIGRGMQVLDVGCGVGDVTCLAAELVGSMGGVVGVDFAAPVLSTARARARSRGIDWVRFVEADITALSLDDLNCGPFDAVVGRLVLMYQADPTAVVRRLAPLVRPGGIVAFLEGIALPLRPWPTRPLYATWIGRVLETFERSGTTNDMGLRLANTFLDAGLPVPDVRLEGIVITGADVTGLQWFTELVRSMAPAMERHGVAQVGGDELARLGDRLVDEAVASPGSVCNLALGGAWARI